MDYSFAVKVQYDFDEKTISGKVQYYWAKNIDELKSQLEQYKGQVFIEWIAFEKGVSKPEDPMDIVFLFENVSLLPRVMKKFLIYYPGCIYTCVEDIFSDIVLI
jgi:hypothetical protein